MGTVSLCSPLISFRFSIFRLALRLVLASRLVRLVFVSRLAFHLSCCSCVFLLCVPSCVSSLRFAFPACPWAMVFDTGTVSPCLPLVLSCRVVSCRSAFRSSSRPASRVSSGHASCLACRLVRLAARLVLRPVFLLARGARPDFHMGAVPPCSPLIVCRCGVVPDEPMSR